MVTKAKSKTPMSADHTAALAKGREESRTVRDYLDALESNRPKRGRRRTPESITKRLSAIDAELETTDNSLTRLHLIQESQDLQAELNQAEVQVDISALEKAFTKVAKSYGQRKGISYSTWRAAGVSAAVLTQAGVARTRS
jgi:flagellar motility protein MotE (MotC chaperone)